jgi:hypothetical protein
MDKLFETHFIRDFIIREFPQILQNAPRLRVGIIKVVKEQFANKLQTEERIDFLLNELKRDREENSKKWQAQLEQNKKEWEERDAKWEAKWDARREEDNKKWDARFNKIDERLDKMDERFDKLEKKVDANTTSIKRLESAFGAMGSRWGIQTEDSFRNALRDILEERFDIQVIKVNEFDHEGFVFGRPDQVEIDIIVKNGLLLIMEIKSHIDRPNVNIFNKKVQYYEKKYGRKADKLIMISPCVEKNAKMLADELNMAIYSYAEDVTL